MTFAHAVHHLLEAFDKDFDWLARRMQKNALLLYCQLHRQKLSLDETEEVVRILGDLLISKVRRETKQP